MFRRCYHVGRALNYPRAVLTPRNSPVINSIKPDGKDDTRVSRSKVIHSPAPENHAEIYVPSSKQIFSNITKPVPPRNVIEVGSSDSSPENSPAKNDSLRKNVVSGDAIVQNPGSTFLRDYGAETNLPEPLFAEERLEHYRSKVPQRIMKMKFEQDTAAKEFEETRTLFELRTAIKLNLPIMDHVNFLDALTAFHRLVSVVEDDDRLRRKLRAFQNDAIERAFFTRDEILNLPEFVVVVKGLVKYCRDFTADETLDATTRLIDMKLPVDSLPMQLFLELMKTHVNRLTINQLVSFFKGLSAAAADSYELEDEGKRDAEETSSSPSLTKLMATLMGTEKLILLRYEEERSWLSCAEIVDIVTFLRVSELTMEIYLRSMTLLITNADELTTESIVQYCLWVRAQSQRSVIRNEALESMHESAFDVFLEILLEDSGENDRFYAIRDRNSVLRHLLSAMTEVCSVRNCLRVKDALGVGDGLETLPFSHASYEVSRLVDLSGLGRIP